MTARQVVSAVALALLCSAIPAFAQLSTGSLSSCPTVLQSAKSTPVIGGGWVAHLAADKLKSPRGILVDNSGNLLVLEQGRGVRRISWKDNGGVCLNVDKSDSVVEMSELNHGIELSDDGKTLYASTADVVYSWSYDAGSGTASDRKTLVQNMTSKGHSTRTLMMSRKVKNMLLVSRGSSENMDMKTRDLSTGISQIRAYDLNNMPGGRPYDQASEGKLVGWGLRNSVGIAEHPNTGGIYSVENSADDIERMNQDIHLNNPGEELNFHGALSALGSNSSQGGRNHGYPDCFALWDTNIPQNRNGNMKVGSQFSLGTTDVDDDDCFVNYEAPRLTFEAHTAPLDIKFSKDGSEAYVSFHGSWNRDDPLGYRVSRIQFENGVPKEASDSRSPTADIMSNPDLSVCPDACFRPVGLAVDSQGRVFVSSDATGEIWVLQKADKATDPGTGGGNNGNAAPTLGTSSLVGSVLIMLFYCYSGLVCSS